MINHGPNPELYELLKKIIESNSDRHPEHLSGPQFEERLAATVEFWWDIGHPDMTVLFRLYIWQKLLRNRELTALLLELSGRECIRQTLRRLERNYQRHVLPDATEPEQ